MAILDLTFKQHPDKIITETVPGGFPLTQLTVGVDDHPPDDPVRRALEKGVLGACKGEHRRLVVPPEMMDGGSIDDGNVRASREGLLTTIDVWVSWVEFTTF